MHVAQTIRNEEAPTRRADPQRLPFARRNSPATMRMFSATRSNLLRSSLVSRSISANSASADVRRSTADYREDFFTTVIGAV